MRRSILLSLLMGATVSLSPLHAAVNSSGVGIVTSNLLMYWNAAHPDSYISGTSIGDLSGNGYTATMQNSISHSRTSAGSYFEFTGGLGTVDTNPYLSLGSINPDFSTGLSVSFYATFGTVANNWERILDFGNNPESSNFLLGRPGTDSYMFYESWDGNRSKGKCTGPSSGTGSIVTTNPPTIQFYTLTVTHSGGCQWYMNGSAISTTQTFYNSYTNINPITTTRSNTWIGRSNWSGDNYLEGRIYSLAIYIRPLSLTEVQQNWSAMTDISWPTVGGGGNIPINENQSNVTSITSNEVGSKFSIVGGNDAAKFTINSTSGALTFITAPNYESPDDFGSNRGYEVTIRVIDPNGNYQNNAVTVTIDNLVESSTLSTPTLAGIAYKGISLNISVTPSGDGTAIPGKVSFYMAGKRIAGCYKKSFSGTGSVVCSWKPATLGYREISVSFTPTNTSFSATSTKKSFWVYKRTTTR